jgi:hypothetical protein
VAPPVTWDLWTFLFGLVGALSVVIPSFIAMALWISRRMRALSMFSDPRLQHFLDDWFGEKARPGFPGRPGIPERLEKVELDTAQLQRNGGAHLADAVARIERHLQTQGGAP